MNTKGRHIASSLFVILFLANTTVLAQEQSLMGHQELMGYYNPSLNAPGKFAEIDLIHRSQWEGFGPTSNLLYFKYPFLKKASFLSTRSVGAYVQYENFSFLSRTSVRVFTSNNVAALGRYSLAIGADVGFSSVGLKLGAFDLAELRDPGLLQVDRDVRIVNRVGVSIGDNRFQVGVSSGFKDFKKISDISSSVTFDQLLLEDKVRLRPALMFRTSALFDTQLEGQLRMIYKDFFQFTVGYRQHFGVLLQMGFKINKGIYGSYGSELPTGRNAGLGITHEIFATGKFETSRSKQHTIDSTFKVQRDSVNRAKLDSMRIVRVNELKAKEDAEDEEAVEKEEQEPIELAEDEVVIASSEQIISFENITLKIGENTHVILDHIGFEAGLYLLKPYAYKELDRLGAYLKHHRHLHIEIQGHTDDSGSASTNYVLSKRRALTIYNYLVNKGIDPVRMNVVGYGQDLPLVPNSSEENRSLNRRIEVIFTKNGE